jgi:hypothetical protein
MKPRYINIAAINANGSPISTQVWTDEPHNHVTEQVLAKWIADAKRDGDHGYPIVSAVSTDLATREVLTYRADGYAPQRLGNLA